MDESENIVDLLNCIAVMDPDDPKFNLEAFLMAKFGDEAK